MKQRGWPLLPFRLENFPDSRIGASLKLGRNRTGLRRTGHFPDSRIGASLKPDAAAYARARRERDFPDSRIGASLKLGRRAGHFAQQRDTSPIRESGPH